jgi:hypothetical protein
LAKYRYKPVTVDAVEWEGSLPRVIKGLLPFDVAPEWHVNDGGQLVITTFQNEEVCQLGDYVIKGTQGEIFSCKPDIFEEIYEKLDSFGAPVEGRLYRG